MTDFFTKKQKKYWCDICRVFIEYNRITIEHHKNTSQHIHNMKRFTKYQKVAIFVYVLLLVVYKIQLAK